MTAGAQRVLVVNAGSSSLKLRLLDAEDRVLGGSDLSAPGGQVPAGAVGDAIGSLGRVDAVGHRVVHGGVEFREPVRLDPQVVARLRALTDLAPLHQPAALALLDVVDHVLPGVPAVACFDTAFHADLPAAAATYALPRAWRERWPLHRFGFHGLSHAWASRRAAELADRPLRDLRIVTCHLGAGASLAAVQGGRSVDTTMGFTPVAGLVMATRSGDVDPGLLLWLQEHAGVPADELGAALERGSGLLGLTGRADMREVLAAEAAGDAEAHLGVEVYLHRLRAAIGSMAAAMDGLDLLVFTGGVGEHAAPIRSRTAAGLGFLGVEVDAERNTAGADPERPDREISALRSRVRTFVVEAREDLEIAREVRRLVS